MGTSVMTERAFPRRRRQLQPLQQRRQLRLVVVVVRLGEDDRAEGTSVRANVVVELKGVS